ncbi:MAG: Crp/Fnr family transcriptional regulator [Flavobacteriales bacterium]|nr:Crp/Fnr family transcriptional regulator [Flavobacteriales bacterium]
MSLIGVDIRPAFVNLFTTEIGLHDGEFAQVQEKFHVKRIPRHGFHLRAGEVCVHTAYVNKGCSRSYTIDPKGKEHVLFFGFEDWWLGDYESFVTQRPGKQFIEAAEDLELLCITHQEFEELGRRFPSIGEWHREKQTKMACAMIDRLIEVKSCSAEERLVALVQHRPDIFQRVALQDIASYLDIAPPSLSRMRRRVLHTKRDP